MLIVGIDFSETAALAVAEARVLGARLELPIHAVHVRLAGRSHAWEPCAEEHAWLSHVGMSSGEIAVRQGTPWVELVRTASEWNARMIVIGTHGLTGFQPVALGSTASRLAVLSPLPVVLVGSRDRPQLEPPAPHYSEIGSAVRWSTKPRTPGGRE